MVIFCIRGKVTTVCKANVKVNDEFAETLNKNNDFACWHLMLDDTEKSDAKPNTKYINIYVCVNIYCLKQNKTLNVSIFKTI